MPSSLDPNVLRGQKTPSIDASFQQGIGPQTWRAKDCTKNESSFSHTNENLAESVLVRPSTVMTLILLLYQLRFHPRRFSACGKRSNACQIGTCLFGIFTFSASRRQPAHLLRMRVKVPGKKLLQGSLPLFEKKRERHQNWQSIVLISSADLLLSKFFGNIQSVLPEIHPIIKHVPCTFKKAYVYVYKHTAHKDRYAPTSVYVKNYVYIYSHAYSQKILSLTPRVIHDGRFACTWTAHAFHVFMELGTL